MLPLRPLLLVLLAAPLAAQGPPPTPADSALRACLAATAGSSAATPAERSQLTTRAEELWRGEAARLPAAAPPKVGLARTLVQCRMALVSGPGEMMGLFQEGVTLLRTALALEPRSWPARLTLGLVYAGAPGFLGFADSAVAQLEAVTAPGALPESEPALADALRSLAELYEQRGRASDAAAARDRAARLPPRSAPAADPPPPAARGADSVRRLEAVTVTVRAAVVNAAEHRGARAVTALDIVTLPGGTADLMQVLQVLPGVTGGSESSDLSLRGGDPAEAPVFLNGSRLAYAGRFESLSGSLFGILDPDVLRHARLHAAAFSARYGDALSGIIETDAIGRPAARSRRIALNAAGPAVTLMEPFGSAGGGWVSAKVTHTGLLLWMQGREHAYATTPLSAQVMAGASRTAGARELRLVGFLEHDDAAPVIDAAGYQGAYRSRGTTAGAVVSADGGRAGSLSNVVVSAALTLRSTRTQFGVLDFSRRLTRAGVRVGGDRMIGPAVTRLGLEAAQLVDAAHGAVPSGAGVAPGSPAANVDAVRHATHLGGFVEASVAPAPWLVVTTGLRADRLPGERRVTADPRVSAVATWGSVSATAAAGVFHQGAFRPSVEQPGSDNRLGVPRRARHVLVGLERRGAVTLRAEAYAKVLDRWTAGTDSLRPRRGATVGADLFVNVPGQRRSAHVTYSVLRSRVALPGGTEIPSAWDVTHGLVAVAAQRLGVAWEIGTTLRVSTGRPYTPLVRQDTAGGAPPLTLGAPNGGRFPAYGRLDARISRYSPLGGRLIVSYAEILNLTGRANVAAYGAPDAAGRQPPITTFFGRRTVVVGVEVR